VIQLVLPIQLPAAAVLRCKARGCDGSVVGSSITGKGRVCRTHNEEEWGRALSRSPQVDHRRLGALLLAEGKVS
jgi:hypothetical protein